MVERLRGRAGQAHRARRMARTHGLCEHCQAAGRVTMATVVDHIVPLVKGGSDEDDNTRNLCDECHRIATAEQFDHQVSRDERGSTRSGWPIAANHPWNRDRRATASTSGPRS